MMKIGRNDPCPCGSGKKFKKCCYFKQTEAGSQQQAASQVSLREEVAKVQAAAVERQAKIMHLGVFVLFSTTTGDAWLLELSDMDGVQVARDGEKIELELEENAETIEINWSHRFRIEDKKFLATSYRDQTVTAYDEYPTHSIQAAVKKIRKRFSQEQLSSIHISEEQSAGARNN